MTADPQTGDENDDDQVMPLVGVPVDSPIEGHVRLLLDPMGGDYFDIPEQAVISREPLPGDLYGRSRLLVRPDAGVTRRGHENATIQRLLSQAATQNVGVFRYRGAESESEIKSVGIVGGGTAGYITALTMRRLRPEIDVTLIESTEIPPIGVGEATTSEIIPYLHLLLGLDIVEFYAKVLPTWKLGIRFEWGRPGDYYFNETFDLGRVLEAQLYDKHIRNMSMMSVLMSDKKAPLIQAGNDIQSLLGQFPFAYHLDNHRLLTYLREKVRASGVRHVERHIERVEVGKKGKSINGLIDDQGDRHQFDLYIDCSGFRSLLLQQSLGTKFISYSNSLFTDRAIVGNVPHDGQIKPYTTAETMDHGWCWNIPIAEEDHRGYVFCSDFASDDEAEAEMRRKNPRLGETRVIEFRSGRHKQCWRGNVVAMGNAYGFVEPLESTGIQALLAMNLMLHRHFPVFQKEKRTRQSFNRQVGEYWDRLRWFLAVHYRFNARSDSIFWKTCRNEADVSGAKETLDLYREAAPLSYRSASINTFAPLPYLPFVYDVMLFGQDVAARYVAAREDRATYKRRVQAYRRLSQRAVSHAEALQILTRRRPDLLVDQVSDPQGWVRRLMAIWEMT